MKIEVYMRWEIVYFRLGWILMEDFGCNYEDAVF